MNQSLFSKIKMLALDVDGVLTDGKLYIGSDGQEIKAFHIHDGCGIKLLQDHGIAVAIISSRNSPATLSRIKDLSVKYHALGEKNKLATLQHFAKQCQITLKEIAYMGDDLPDFEVMQAVGLPIAVANATRPILEIAKWRTEKPGGSGAVREICDLILAHSTIECKN